MLDYWLGQSYHALVVKGDGDETIAIFKKRIEADQSLKKKAQQRLIDIKAANHHAHIAGGTRCFVSKKQAEILESVLN